MWGKIKYKKKRSEDQRTCDTFDVRDVDLYLVKGVGRWTRGGRGRMTEMIHSKSHLNKSRTVWARKVQGIKSTIQVVLLRLCPNILCAKTITIMGTESLRAMVVSLFVRGPESGRRRKTIQAMKGEAPFCLPNHSEVQRDPITWAQAQVWLSPLVVNSTGDQGRARENSLKSPATADRPRFPAHGPAEPGGGPQWASERYFSFPMHPKSKRKTRCILIFQHRTLSNTIFSDEKQFKMDYARQNSD